MTRTNNNAAANYTQAMEEMRALFSRAMESINSSTTVEQTVDSADNTVSAVTAKLFEALDTVGRLTGFTTLRLSVARVLEAGLNEETGKKELKMMAGEIRVIIEEQVQQLRDCWLDDEADILMELVKKHSIFSMFFGSIAWVAGKVVHKLSSVIPNLSEKKVIGGICKGIKGIAGLVNRGVKVILNIAKFTVSFVGATALMLADFIVSGIKWVIGAAYGLYASIALKFTADDEEDEGYFEEEFFEDDGQDLGELEDICPHTNSPYNCGNCSRKQECPDACYVVQQ